MLLRSVTPEEMIPFFGMVTGIVFMICAALGIVGVARSQIGAAIARRLHGKAGADPELRDELETMRERVATLEHRLSDSEERLDFTERLLARSREPAQLTDAARTDRH